MNLKKTGYTLIEILVAISIIAVLTAVGVTSFTSVNKKSRDAKRKSDIEQIRSALEMYRADNGSYPATDNLDDLEVDSYIAKIPLDPKDGQTGYTYVYTALGSPAYSYTLQALLENPDDSDNSCIPTEPKNYCVKNP